MEGAHAAENKLKQSDAVEATEKVAVKICEPKDEIENEIMSSSEGPPAQSKTSCAPAATISRRGGIDYYTSDSD